MPQLTLDQFSEARRRYEAGESIAPIAASMHVSRAALWERFKRAGVQMRPQARYGPDNNRYRNNCGKGWRTPDGYILVYRDGQEILEHRYVMGQIIGRKLLPGEDVHHRNKQRDDNRPENLELLDHVEHVRRHREGTPIPSIRGQWKHRPDITTEKVVELRRQGIAPYRIGKILGCSQDTVDTRLRAAECQDASI